MDSLPAAPPGKPQNTEVGAYSFSSGFFLTQESNAGSPALQVNSLPTDLSETLYHIKKNFFKSYNKGHTFPGIGRGGGLVAKSCPILSMGIL